MKILKISLLSLCGIFLVMQFFRVKHTNPPVVQEPAWDSPRTRALAQRACFDCHSNETKYPWYTYVAPISWLTQNHIEEGREKLNFSEWHKPQEGDEAAETVIKGEMPTMDYLWLHARARLTNAEKKLFVAGLIKTFGKKGKKEAERDASDD